jgi:hypothetical protein
MPFDRIAVTMKLKRVYECGFDLYFEYFKAESSGEKVKLAYGTHTLAWVQVENSHNYIPRKLSETHLKLILDVASKNKYAI